MEKGRIDKDESTEGNDDWRQKSKSKSTENGEIQKAK
jgi:hypothetical protein